MLKIEINFFSNIKFKNSKSTLHSLYKRIYFYNIFFFLNNIKNKKNIIYNNNSHILSNKIVLLRSPFHYKTSKTLINSPKNKFTIKFIIKKKLKTPLFYNKKLIKNLLCINKLNYFSIKNIKITQ